MHVKLKELLKSHHVSIKLEALTFHSNLIPDIKVEHPMSTTYHRQAWQAINTKGTKSTQLSKAEDWSIERRLLMDAGHL